MLLSAHVYVKDSAFEYVVRLSGLALLGAIADVNGEAVVGLFCGL